MRRSPASVRFSRTYKRHFILTGLGAGVLNALPLLIFALLSLLAPSVGRRHSLERVLTWAVAAILLGTLVRSVPLPGAIWIGTGVLSAGIAFGNVLLPGLVKREFPTKAAGLIGLYAASMAGMAGVAAGIAVPITHVAGLDWRWAVGCWALLAAITLVVWLPQWTVPSHAPSATGIRIKEGVSPWKHPIGWQVSLFFALHSLVFYSIVDWFASYAASRNVAPEAAGFYLLVYQIVAVATNLACPPIIRRFKDQRLLGFLCGLLLVIGTAGLYSGAGSPLIWLISAGFGAGTAMTTSLALFTLRTHDHHQAASLSGMAQFVGYVGAAAGPFLIGVLRDIDSGWTWPLILLIASSILVVVFATLAGRGKYIE
ncbi:MFS transporter [Pseudomonas sp. Hp2]|uniref:MFS transporter n=1 Tax=Pseudomonas sp. Hp2 TaxID=701189 RepID=UPI002114057C|nr:MFS transporter [Pseudomonas sp. Hp2]